MEWVRGWPLKPSSLRVTYPMAGMFGLLKLAREPFGAMGRPWEWLERPRESAGPKRERRTGVAGWFGGEAGREEPAPESGERRVGQECVSTCRSWWSPGL